MIGALTLVQLVPLFGVSAALLAVGGVVLARAGDEIAKRTGMSRAVVGVVLLALATSLPELVTDVGAAAANAPNLAVGDLFGSSMANMAVLGILDLSRRRRVWQRVELGHARVASVAIGLTALAALGILTSRGWSIGWIGIDTVLVAAGYVAAVTWMHRSPAVRGGGVVPEAIQWPDDGGSVRQSVGKFAGATLLILVSAPLVAYAGRGIAVETGLGETFVGIALVAIATSLPELVTSLAAVRIGAQDLAVGNLFGSNALNMALLVFVDAAYTRGPVLAAVDVGQVVGAVGAVLLMALALAAIIQGSETRIGRLEPDALLVLLVYLGTLFAVWSVHR
ncbi:MAG: sodium:calcium antiporter [Acidimicrobiia bacterium]|nr:sodium:calcium antiporter [Acidimicrobiia bacterium]